MNKFKNYLLASAGFVIFTLTVALMNAGQVEASGTSNTPNLTPAPTPTPAGTAPVTVMNATSNPVPTSAQGTTTISGNVNVSNTPTVNSQQNGLWNVGILGIPTFALSPSANTVQAQQNGAWHVGITGTPTFGISPSANTIQAQQNGSWSVGINGTPTFGISPSANTIQAQQNGSWNVGITGTPNVNIVGTPTVALAPGSTVQLGTPTAPVLVRDVDNPARQPFRDSFRISTEDFLVCGYRDVVVPGDKRLVIENVNIRVFADPGRTLWVELRSSGLAQIDLPLKPQGTFDQPGVGQKDLLIANEPLRLYLDPNEHLSICVQRQRFDQNVNEAYVSLFGHYVDVP